MANTYDEQYIKARAGLLDALGALGPLRRAVILVGAQAVYIHSESVDADFAVSPFTYDADIVLDPETLGTEPDITKAMQDAGFSLDVQPGIYKRDDGSQVDLLVPAAVGGPGRRGARLDGHQHNAARKAHGLEGALVSHNAHIIRSLTPATDTRSFNIEIAGPAALLVAKIHKISERISKFPSENLSKDAFDIYRLLHTVSASKLSVEVQLLLKNNISKAVTESALSQFRELFGKATADGPKLVAAYLSGIEDSDFIIASSIALSQDFLEAAEIVPNN